MDFFFDLFRTKVRGLVGVLAAFADVLFLLLLLFDAEVGELGFAYGFVFSNVFLVVHLLRHSIFGSVS